MNPNANNSESIQSIQSIQPIPSTDASSSASSPACSIVLQNISGTVNLCTLLDLKTVYLKTRNSEYNPRRFCAVILRIRNPKTTALAFASGKMVITGAKSPAACKLAAKKFAWIIRKVGFEQVKFREFRIQNMLGTVDVGFPIKLEPLSLHHIAHCSYEPEIFAGLIYKMLCPKICLLIFVSGKLVITGGKTIEQLEQALHNIYPILQEFQKNR